MAHPLCLSYTKGLHPLVVLFVECIVANDVVIQRDDCDAKSSISHVRSFSWNGVYHYLPARSVRLDVGEGLGNLRKWEGSLGVDYWLHLPAFDVWVQLLQDLSVGSDNESETRRYHGAG